MEPMKKVQVEGSLMYVEPQEIFGNLDELCYVRILLHGVQFSEVDIHSVVISHIFLY